MPSPSRCFRALAKDRGGGVAPLLALAVLPVMAGLGAAVDYSRASAARTAMQAALDSTALAMAGDDSAAAQTAASAQQMFDARFARPEVSGVSVAAVVENGAGATSVKLTASGSVPTEFMGGFGYEAMQISARSEAVRQRDEFGCVLALSPDAADAIALKGNTAVSLKGCSLYSNSKDQAAFSVGGSAEFAARSVAVVGGVSISPDNVTTDDGIRTGISPVADPYAHVALPAFSGCDATNLSIKSATTLTPGVYCKGLAVNAGATLSLDPGIYIFDRGTFSVSGGASVTGTGVTLVFTSSTGRDWADVTINGGAAVHLTPPNTGATAGIVIFGDRAMPTSTTFKFNGGASQYLGGAIYVPSGELSFSGGMGTSTSCTQLIGYRIDFTGNSDVALNCSSYKVETFGAKALRLAS